MSATPRALRESPGCVRGRTGELNGGTFIFEPGQIVGKRPGRRALSKGWVVNPVADPDLAEWIAARVAQGFPYLGSMPRKWYHDAGGLQDIVENGLRDRNMMLRTEDRGERRYYFAERLPRFATPDDLRNWDGVPLPPSEWPDVSALVFGEWTP